MRRSGKKKAKSPVERGVVYDNICAAIDLRLRNSRSYPAESCIELEDSRSANFLRKIPAGDTHIYVPDYGMVIEN